MSSQVCGLYPDDLTSIKSFLMSDDTSEDTSNDTLWTLFCLLHRFMESLRVFRHSHRSTAGSPTCRLQVLPVLLTSPGSDPRLGVHLESTSPHLMLLRASRLPSSFLRKLLRHSSDVIRFESTTSSYISDSGVVSLTCKLLYVPPGKSS